MTIRAKQLEVPREDPFRFDRLKRKAFVEALSETLASSFGPAVFTIDGAWGTGKTTFVRMLAEVLRQKEVKVVEINAWETDYERDPLVALTNALTSELQSNDQKKQDRFQKAASNLVLTLILAILKAILESAFPSINAVSEKFASELSRLLERSDDAATHRASSVKEFQDSLRQLACSIPSDGPLVVIVDELDRCRPEYAVSMLETIKHFFETDGVVFVLALNRKQLDHSAKVLYGSPSDPDSYFGKFFDIELRLPLVDKSEFVESTMSDLKLDQSEPLAVSTLAEFLNRGPYSPQTIDQTIRLYNLVESGLRQTSLQRCQFMLVTAILCRLIVEGSSSINFSVWHINLTACGNKSASASRRSRT